jgi:hypothetical protein
MISRVFLPQVVMRYSEAAGKPIPLFDFSAAEQFGQIVPILDDSDNPLFLTRLMPKIKKSLADFSPNDYFLAVGDPAVMSVCAGIIMRRQASIKLLKWNRRLTVYTPMEINLT